MLCSQECSLLASTGNLTLFQHSCMSKSKPCNLFTEFCCVIALQDYELLAGGRALTESAMCGQLQNSITACVYFLTPHRVKKVDLIMMSALSQLVSVSNNCYFATC